MENQIKEFNKSIGIMHLALLAGQVIFACVAAFLIYDGSFVSFVLGVYRQSVLGVVASLTILGIMGSSALFKKQVTKIVKVPESEKLIKYRSATIIRFAILEGMTFMNVLLAMVTGELYFFAITAIPLAAFILVRPTYEKISADLNPDKRITQDDPIQ